MRSPLESSGSGNLNSGVAEVSDEDLLLRLSLLMIDELLLRLRIAFKRSANAHLHTLEPVAQPAAPLCSWSRTSHAI